MYPSVAGSMHCILFNGPNENYAGEFKETFCRHQKVIKNTRGWYLKTAIHIIVCYVDSAIVVGRRIIRGEIKK